MFSYQDPHSPIMATPHRSRRAGVPNTPGKKNRPVVRQLNGLHFTSRRAAPEVIPAGIPMGADMLPPGGIPAYHTFGTNESSNSFGQLTSHASTSGSNSISGATLGVSSSFASSVNFNNMYPASLPNFSTPHDSNGTPIPPPVRVSCDTPTFLKRPPSVNELFTPVMDYNLNINYGDTNIMGTSTTTIGSLWNRYIMDFTEIKELGRGKFGKVVCAARTRDGELFAIKQIECHRPSAIEIARRDVEILAHYHVSRCPNIVSLYNAWTEGSVTYLQMEYCPGGTLWDAARECIEQGRRWNENEIRLVLADIVLALHTCHTRDVAHGDVKLENILIDASGHYKLSDFGVAVFLSTRGRPKPTLDATPKNGLMWSQEEGDARYLPRDMMNERQHFKPGDVYALGISLYELMSAHPLPKSGEEYHLLRKGFVCNIYPMYGSELNGLVTAMMSEDPLQRPTVQDLLHHSLLRYEYAPRQSSSTTPYNTSTPRTVKDPSSTPTNLIALKQNSSIQNINNLSGSSGDQFNILDLRVQQSLLLCEHRRLEMEINALSIKET